MIFSMKRFPVFLLLIITTLCSFAQTGLDIKVHVRGFDAETAILGFYRGGQTLMKDSAVVENGTFTFHSDTLYPSGMYLVVLPPEMQYFDMFLDEDQTFSIRTDMEDLTGSLELEGSELNSIFYNDIRFLQEQQQLILSLQASVDSTMDDIQVQEIQDQIRASQNAITSNRESIISDHPDLLYSRFLQAVKGPEIPEKPEGEDEYWAFFWFRTHYFDHLDLSDRAMLRTPIANAKVMDYLDKYTVQDPDSLMEAVDVIIENAARNEETFQYYLSSMFNKYLESKLLMSEAVMIHIAKKYYLTGKAPWISEDYLEKLRKLIREKEGTLVGDIGKDFQILDLNDQPVRLYDLDAEWIVLYFWSYDCGTCKKVTPELAKMMPSFIEDGVQLVTVCTNGDRDIWKEKVAEYGIPGVALADPARTSGFDQFYNIDHTPMIYVLDKDHVIRYKQISVEDLGAVLDFELEQ